LAVRAAGRVRVGVPIDDPSYMLTLVYIGKLGKKKK
jgi:hypothetical protein